MRRNPRLAAGRARALGLPTRGTTNPNRLRRMDNWITATLAAPLRSSPDPLVVDLGYGASPVTTVEFAKRLGRVRSGVRVVGVELDAKRVAAALFAADPPRISFVRGGFELAGLEPTLVRAGNVLRQYDERAAAEAWTTMTARLARDGVVVDGTCDETGRRGSWVLLDRAGPQSLTLACRVDAIERPSDLAERLPKALIHHNVPGKSIHAFLGDLDRAWDAAAPQSAFGPKQRWIAACAAVAGDWPVQRDRARRGEVTVAWAAVSP